MAVSHGRLEEFHPESDSIKSYLERVALYFTANDIPNGKKVPILLSSIGAPTYSLLSDLLAPELPSGKTFGEISAVLQLHYEPKRAIIAERFHFHKRDQAEGESVANFDAALRKLATHCQFAANLEDSLRDRFVCGMRHQAMQRRLLSEKDLTYRKAVEIAHVMEAADRDTKAFKPQEQTILKFRAQHHTSKCRERQACYRCGRTNHAEENCKFKEAECHRCGKLGHIAPMCRSKSTKFSDAHQPDERTHSVRANHVKTEQDEDEEDNSDTEEYHLF